MKPFAPLYFCLFSVILTVSAVTAGCGGANVNDAPGISASTVANSQNPLVAQFTATTTLACPGQIMVAFGPDTTYGRSTAFYPLSAAPQSSTILVAGMRASTTYHMQAQAQQTCGTVISNFTGPDLTFTTGPLPSLPLPTLTVSRPAPSTTFPENPGVEMINVTAPGTPAFFTDRDANPVWFYDVGQGNSPTAFKLLPNGHMIVLISRSGQDANLIEMDLAGNTVRQIDAAALATSMQSAGFDFLPATFHHDVLPLPNGHLLLLVNFTKNFTDLPGYPGTTSVLGDGIIDLDQNWNPVWAWNSFDYLDVNRHLNGLPDWTHSNALVFSSDGNLFLSMRHQSWILKIDYNNGTGAGDILWRLGYQGDFALTQNNVLTDDPSLWFSFQHFPSIVSQSGSQTSFTIWDNGDNRPLDLTGDLCGLPPSVPCFSRATVFQLDESTMTAGLMWADSPGFYGNWGGSIQQLANTNVEFDLNSASPSPNGDAASEVQEVTQQPTPQVVWKLDISPTTETAYRAYRVPSLYNGVIWAY